MSTIEQTLHALGFSSFRAGQAETIRAIVNGHSAAAIFPTGSGKSLCYQIAALHLPGLTLVVSPLLALIQDQIEFMRSKGIAAGQIDSTLSREAERQTIEAIKSRSIKILMISVERFKNERFRNFIAQIPVSLLVVDEAHCISEWGHNFRPDYLKLPVYQKRLNIPQVLLLTATATPKVVADMQRAFGIRPEHVIKTGFYRPNLHITVLEATGSNKKALLQNWLASHKQRPTIIYVTLQKTAEEVALLFKDKGLGVEFYHAGMKHEEREAVQIRFMRGETNTIVATIAFGMGIDKADIGAIIHYDLPKSIENYSQEIGRAGRNGGQADCVVLAAGDNVNILKNFVYGDTPEYTGIMKVLSEIKQVENNWEFTWYQLSNLSNIRQLPLKTLVTYLEMAGIIVPAYSYFAEYQFANVLSNSDIISKFTGERQDFVRKIFSYSTKAVKWSAIDMATLTTQPGCNRERVVAALEYFSQQGYIALETRQSTEVYHVEHRDFDMDTLAQQMYQLFVTKEANEIARIDEMVQFFGSANCLTKQLSEYFGESTDWQRCGHCSACISGAVRIDLPPFSIDLIPGHVDLSAILNLFDQASVEIITRFLCGITVPVFTKLRAKSKPGFGSCESFPYSEIKKWVKKQLEK